MLSGWHNQVQSSLQTSHCFLTQGRRKADTIPISLPSSDKPARPKRLHSNAQIFDDSEGENSTDSDLDKPVAKRLRQMPAEVKDVVSTHTVALSSSAVSRCCLWHVMQGLRLPFYRFMLSRLEIPESVRSLDKLLICIQFTTPSSFAGSTMYALICICAVRCALALGLLNRRCACRKKNGK